MTRCLGLCGPYQVRKFSFDPKEIEPVGDPTPKPPGDVFTWPKPDNDTIEKAFKAAIDKLEQPEPIPGVTKDCTNKACKCRLIRTYTDDEEKDSIEVKVPLTTGGTTYTFKFKCPVGRKDGLGQGVCSDPPGQVYYCAAYGSNDDLGLALSIAGPHDVTPELLSAVSGLISEKKKAKKG